MHEAQQQAIDRVFEILSEHFDHVVIAVGHLRRRQAVHHRRELHRRRRVRHRSVQALREKVDQGASLGSGRGDGLGRLRPDGRLGIILNGVTGRMGTNQHYIRSILAIMQQGGVRLGDGTRRSCPRPILVGRNEAKLAAARRDGSRVVRWTHRSRRRAGRSGKRHLFRRADDRPPLRCRDARRSPPGKHVYCEKPTAVSTAQAYELYAARAARPA